MYLSPSGISDAETVARVKAAKEALREMQRMGFLSGQTSPQAAKWIYDTDIRPIYDYGCAITPYSKAICAAIDDLDAVFFRILISEPTDPERAMRDRRRNRLRALFCIEPFHLRQRAMQTKLTVVLPAQRRPA